MVTFRVQREERAPLLKAVGVGGKGCRMAAAIARRGMAGVECLALNADERELRDCEVTWRLQVGQQVVGRAGTGGDPEVGRQALEEDRKRIEQHLAGAEVVVVMAGMGGGTGTGGASVLARIAREAGCLTLAVVTTPFPFEGGRRMEVAQQGIEALEREADAVTVISSEQVLTAGELPALEALQREDEHALRIVQSIAEFLTLPGPWSPDISKMRKVLAGGGRSFVGFGTGRTALEAARHALNSPFLEEMGIRGASRLLVGVTAGGSLSFQDLNDAFGLVRSEAHEDALCEFGMVIDPRASAEVRMTLIATAFRRREEDFLDFLRGELSPTAVELLEEEDFPPFLLEGRRRR